MAPTAAAAEAEAEKLHTRKTVVLAARDASGHLFPLTLTRRNTGDDDVAIKILLCGICHSDLHSIKNEWKNAIYPLVPGEPDSIEEESEVFTEQQEEEFYSDEGDLED